MASSFAFTLFIVGIGTLLFLDRDKAVHTSRFLWLPVIWLWINGSRPVSAWLGMEVVDESRSLLPDSNSLDQVVAGTLIAVGIAVLIQRRREVNVVLRASWPIILFFVYCLLSLLWSDFPLWGFKRWFRELGELAMVLIVVTDAQPIATRIACGLCPHACFDPDDQVFPEFRPRIYSMGIADECWSDDQQELTRCHNLGCRVGSGMADSQPPSREEAA